MEPELPGPGMGYPKIDLGVTPTVTLRLDGNFRKHIEQRFVGPALENIITHVANRCQRETTKNATVVEDGRDTLFSDKLRHHRIGRVELAAGLEALEDKKMILDFSFTPNLDGLQGQYNVDWKLGDHVTAEYAGYTQDVRIQGISVSVAENESINIQLENTLI